MTTDEVGSGLGAFSQDILKIEVNGPDVRTGPSTLSHGANGWIAKPPHGHRCSRNLSRRYSRWVFYLTLRIKGLLTRSIGLTTETDITLVENMVKSYMSNRRTMLVAAHRSHGALIG